MKDQVIRAFALGENTEDIAMEFDIPVHEVKNIIVMYKKSISEQ